MSPSSGVIKVDDRDIFQNIISWQKRIGLVPQENYLLDDTIKANIAFGEDIKDFDHVRFTKSLKTSNLDVFVKNLDKKEKLDWHNSSSYFDNYFFEYEYPRTNGFVSIGQTYTAAGTAADDGVDKFIDVKCE